MNLVTCIGLSRELARPSQAGAVGMVATLSLERGFDSLELEQRLMQSR